MDPQSREIYKNSLIRGLFNKQTAIKESILAEITLLLEGDGYANGAAPEVFEQKIEGLLHADNMLAQLEAMFTNQKGNKVDERTEDTDNE